MSVCASCDEQEHDCCLRLLRPDACGCGCPADANFTQPPMVILPLFWFMQQAPIVRTRQGRMPRMRAARCSKGHPLKGDNIYWYWEDGKEKYRCWTCRRASWRSFSRRRNQNGNGAVA